MWVPGTDARRHKGGTATGGGGSYDFALARLMLGSHRDSEEEEDGSRDTCPCAIPPIMS